MWWSLYMYAPCLARVSVLHPNGCGGSLRGRKRRGGAHPSLNSKWKLFIDWIMHAELTTQIAEAKATFRLPTVLSHKTLMTNRTTVTLMKRKVRAKLKKYRIQAQKITKAAQSIVDTRDTLAITQREQRTPAWRDWAEGLPDDVLAKIATAIVRQADAAFIESRIQRIKTWNNPQNKPSDYFEHITNTRANLYKAQRAKPGRSLFVFATVCKRWRTVQQIVGNPLRSHAVTDVVRHGRVALAKWALANGCPNNTSWRGTEMLMVDTAAMFGHMDLVQWLCQDRGHTIDRNVMAWAASSGNLNLVQWLRSEGCPWDGDTYSFAARKGHLELMKWLHANGCPWTTCVSVDGEDADYEEPGPPTVCENAARGGHVATLRWAIQNGCPYDAEYCAWILFAWTIGFTTTNGRIIYPAQD